ASTPVNRAVEVLSCAHCYMDSPLAPAIWERVLSGLEADVTTWGRGFGTSTNEREAHKVEWYRGRDGPPCAACKAPMVALLTEPACACAGCWARRPYEVVPPAIA